ncbi:MAG: DUF72 domain-containing protein, partial [Polyangiaceae bacterium]
MRVLVGTSGYSYKPWQGPFYPKTLPAARFLSFYASALATVEINNTFYRMPTPDLLERWARDVPEGFLFALKAPQRITHIAKLKDAGEALATFAHAANALGSHLGPLLFQLPPNLRKDVPRLTAFLEKARLLKPAGQRFAFEFRHPSWFDDDVMTELRAHGAALCLAESDTLETPLIATADWGYVRLRRDAYPKA